MKWFAIIVSCLLSCFLVSAALAKDIPVTPSLGFPLRGNWWNLTGFSFGASNPAFDGHHLAVDTQVSVTPVGTEVFSPCTGIVRVSDDRQFSGYGADSPAHPDYKGYALVIECRVSQVEWITVLLGHVEEGSDIYNAQSHQGLAPVGSFVYKGQYVAQVASYWHGAGSTVNWHHLHFGIRRGVYDSHNPALFVRGYEANGWNADFTQQANWVEPTSYIRDHSLSTTWHPDGTLVQLYGYPEIYLVSGQKLWHIKDESVFRAHNFSAERVLFISQAEYDCYETVETDIDWQPYREFFLVGGVFYLIERSCEQCENCTIYPFATDVALESWGYENSVAEFLDPEAWELVQYRCGWGEELYLHEGYLSRLSQEIYPGQTFVTAAKGKSYNFENEETFWRLGYDYDDVAPISLDGSASNYDEMIAASYLSRCEVRDNGGGGPNIGHCPENAIQVDYSGEEGTSGVGLCQDQITQCLGGVWQVTQSEILPSLEVADGLDNDCDGEVDEGLNPEPDLIPEIQVQEVVEEVTEVIEVAEIAEPEVTVICSLSCTWPYQAYFWYADTGEIKGQPTAVLTTTLAEICLRGAPWIDYNCALPDWQSYDPEIGQISCNQDIWYGPGKVDYGGEGEIWFYNLSCY